MKSLIDAMVGVWGWYHEDLKFKLINEEGPPEDTWWCWSAGPGNSTHWSDTKEGCLMTCGERETICTDFACMQMNDRYESAHWLLLVVALNAWAPVVSHILAVVMG